MYSTYGPEDHLQNIKILYTVLKQNFEIVIRVHYMYILFIQCVDSFDQLQSLLQ
jgi:hypothetical protein